MLTTGPLPPNPVEFLSSKGMQAFIKEVREQYDRIIFDTPPVGILTDAALVSAHTDGTLLVVASGKSDIELTLKSKENLKNVKANLLGVVMTMMPVTSKQYYHYYHSYGLEVKSQNVDLTLGRRKHEAIPTTISGMFIRFNSKSSLSNE